MRTLALEESDRMQPADDPHLYGRTRRRRSIFQFSMRTLLVLMLLVAVFLGGRVSFRPRPKPITGSWEMTLPAGFKHTIEIVQLDEHRFLLQHPSINSAGIYELAADGKLTIVESANASRMGFVWQLRDDGTMILVGQPPTAKVGANYLGATLSRLESAK